MTDLKIARRDLTGEIIDEAGRVFIRTPFEPAADGKDTLYVEIDKGVLHNCLRHHGASAIHWHDVGGSIFVSDIL